MSRLNLPHGKSVIITLVKNMTVSLSDKQERRIYVTKYKYGGGTSPYSSQLAKVTRGGSRIWDGEVRQGSGVKAPSWS